MPLLTRYVLSAPTLGVAAAAATLAIPVEGVVRRTLDVLPELVTTRLEPIAALLPKGSARVALAVGVFTAGFTAGKCIGCLRLFCVRMLLRYQGWVHGQRWTTRIWALLLKFVEGPGPYTTYEFQSCLAHQPLPDLNETLDRYIEACRHFLTESQFVLTRQEANYFRVKEGPILQAHLMKRRKNKDNWLADYWSYAAYLSNREPLLFNSNFTTTEVLNPAIVDNPIVRAATFIHGAWRYDEKLKANELQPVMLQGCVPLCMNGYRNIFNSTRIPGEYVDTVEQFPGNNYVVVIRNGHYFKLERYATNASGKLTELTAEEIKQQLLRIQRLADESVGDAPLPVAALCTQDRTTWFKHRQLLIKSSKESLDTVEKCMFIVVLDEGSPQNANELATLVTSGRGNDRWVDKSFTFVAFANGYCGINVEHSELDATVFGAFTTDLMDISSYDNGDVIKDPRNSPRSLVEPKRIIWNVSGMREAIDGASKAFKELAEDIDIHVLNADYGKGYMKKCRISPDGFIQMTLQLAYYRMYKETPKTYEPATNRLFKFGRTETIHPGSTWSRHWVLSMTSPTARVEDRVSLLKHAVDHQTRFRLDSTIGRGCDRHLLGLLCAAAELKMPRPKFYSEEGWVKSYRLSTSQTPNEIYERLGVGKPVYSLCGGLFGPTSHDGYGVSYIIYGDDVLNIYVTSRRSCPDTDSTKFAGMIKDALGDMKSLFESHKKESR